MPGGTLKPGQTIAKTLLNEPILFGRTQAGDVFALRDICPHRGIPLSCGWFNGSEVECCYHGWRFDAAGQCTAIPGLVDDQKVDRSRFGVKSYPVREVQGNVWIYMPSDDKHPKPTSEPPQLPGFEDRSYQVAYAMSFPCYVDHAVSMFVDPLHVPFVHRSWWWRSDISLEEEVKAFDPAPFGFTMRRHPLARQTFLYRLIGEKPEIEISLLLPGVRIEQIITDRHRVCNLTTATPISETETEVTNLLYTTLPWVPMLKPILTQTTRMFLAQDREVLVKQARGLKYNPPLTLVKDPDAQVRWYFQLKAEFARSVSENRPFVNPVKEQVLRWRS